MDEDVVKALRDILKQMEAQHQAIVNLTDVLGKYLAIPIKVDADNSPVSFQEGSSVSVKNKPTVAAEQAGNWNVSTNSKRIQQNWVYKIVLGPTGPAGLGASLNKVEMLKFNQEIDGYGAQGWEVVNITGYPQVMATLKKPS